MIRVLHIFHEMGNGGIEHFVMDNYRHIDRSRVQFDFLVSTTAPGFYDDEILTMGGRMYRAYPLRKNPIRNYYDIARIVRENHYDIVHRHTGSAFGYFDLRAARHGGASHLILHSHNNLAGNMMLHKVCKMFLTIPCEKLACSQEAGEWLFGKNASFTVIKNAVDCQKFSFNESVRTEMRKELNVDNQLVLGHVGRFETQKNHIRMMQIIAEVVKHHNNSVLVCIGTGSLQKACADEADKLGITDHVKFLGSRSDVHKLVQAFDIFLLPSLYEGLPFVLVEAQASGLPCAVSTNVPAECNITGNVRFMELERTNQEWATFILNSTEMEKPREYYAPFMQEVGYDIFTNAEKLCRYYENMVI